MARFQPCRLRFGKSVAAYAELLEDRMSVAELPAAIEHLSDSERAAVLDAARPLASASSSW